MYFEYVQGPLEFQKDSTKPSHYKHECDTAIQLHMSGRTSAYCGSVGSTSMHETSSIWTVVNLRKTWSSSSHDALHSPSFIAEGSSPSSVIQSLKVSSRDQHRTRNLLISFEHLKGACTTNGHWLNTLVSNGLTEGDDCTIWVHSFSEWCSLRKHTANRTERLA